MTNRRGLLAGAVLGVLLLLAAWQLLTPGHPLPATATASRNATRADGPLGAVPLASGTQGAAAVPQITGTAGPEAITAAATYQLATQRLSYRGLQATVYRPITSTAHPAVYFVHGGFWLYGTRNQYDREARIWAARGWVAVTLDYTLGVEYRMQLQDLTAGISLAERQPYVDPSRQILFGDSAGGHLAALAAVEHPGHFCGQVLFSPIVSPLNAYLDGREAAKSSRQLSDAANLVVGHDWAAADPSLHVTRHTPAAWIASSQADFVPFDRQGRLLAIAMGSRASVHLLPGLRHGKALEEGPLVRSARTWARAQVLQKIP